MKNLFLCFGMLSIILLLAKGASAQDNMGISNTNSMVSEPVMHVYPNPSQGIEAHINFGGAKFSDLLVVVYDMLGREMYSKIEIEENDGFLFSFDPALAPGVYLIIASSNDIVYKQKLVVK